MARDRQRAKRRQRRAQNPGPAASKPHRDNVPGELDHISGQVEEFEAAIVAGGEGVASDEPLEAEAEADVGAAPQLEAEPEELYDADELDEELVAEVADEAAPAARPGAPAKRSGNSVINFLRASWAELQRVQWPDRRQVGQATAVVLGFVVIAGAYLGLADALAQELVNFIL
jgi:preprotein translocase SecE subunit